MWKEWTLEIKYLNQSVGVLLDGLASAHNKVFRNL